MARRLEPGISLPENQTPRKQKFNPAQQTIELLREQTVDLTEHRRVVEALQESEERLRAIWECATDGIVLTDAEGIVLAANPAYCQLHGHTLAEIVGQSFALIFPEAQQSWAVEQYKSIFASPASNQLYETPVRHADGSERTVEARVDFVTKNGQRMALLWIVRDITKHRQAEEALKHRLEFETLITTLSTQFINLPIHSIDHGINQALQTIGEFVGVDRSYVLTLSKDKTWGSNTHLWLAPGIEEPQINNFQDLSIEAFQWEMKQLEQFKIIYIPRVTNLSSEAEAEKKICQMDGVQSFLIVPMVYNGTLVGLIRFDSIRAEKNWPVESMTLLRIVSEMFVNVLQRKRAEEALHRRNRELALVNRASQVFTSTLDLDQVLAAVLEEVRHVLDVVACSAWLIDPATNELVCRHVTDPQSELVRGWRLAPGQGLVGWVARHGRSLIVADAQADARHFDGIDQQTGLNLRSILSVPLRAKQQVIGVLQAVDERVGHFSDSDLAVLESLAATAAIALENARLYEQARQNAEIKSALLHEVNHRVKNNLAAIIGLLYAEQYHVGLENQPVYQTILTDLINRVQGLATVHSLLSASEWNPLLLSELTRQIIRSTLQVLPRDKRVLVDVSPSPVRVMPDQAHNLALVINELATNTIRHTLIDRSTVHLTVDIGLVNDTVRCEFRDDGPGYPAEMLQSNQRRQTLGFDLIQNIVRKSLQGELFLYNDHGAVAVIQFKAKLVADKENSK